MASAESAVAWAAAVTLVALDVPAVGEDWYVVSDAYWWVLAWDWAGADWVVMSRSGVVSLRLSVLSG